MSEKKGGTDGQRRSSPDERLKYEIAGELGLLDKVKEGGWRALSSKETGRIGGLIAKRKRKLHGRHIADQKT